MPDEPNIDPFDKAHAEQLKSAVETAAIRTTIARLDQMVESLKTRRVDLVARESRAMGRMEGAASMLRVFEPDTPGGLEVSRTLIDARAQELLVELGMAQPEPEQAPDEPDESPDA